MSRMTEGELVPLGPWPDGANNLALETSVPRRSFRQGVNVDVTDDGKVKRRDGYALAISVDEPEGLMGYGNRGFFVAFGSLFGFEWINGGASAPIELLDGVGMGGLYAHTMVEPDIYFSDGRTAYRIRPDNSVVLWSPPMADTPALAVVDGGSLENGRYIVAIAYKLDTGEEGPLSLATDIEVNSPNGGTVSVTLPLSVPPLVNRIAVYVTKPGGKELLLQGVVPAGAATVTIARQRLGRPPVSQDMDEMPAGRHAATWNGRLLVAQENRVHWSQPMQYSLTQIMYDYAEFSEEVTMVAAVDTAQGYFVGQLSSTYFVGGADPSDSRLVKAYPAGVVPGTLAYVPGARLPLDAPPTQLVPMWMATNGVFCVGMPDGSILPLTETRYAAKPGDQGAALFSQREGLNRFVATVRNPSDNAFAISDAVSAEVRPPS